jgi:hypothetical protein
MGQAGQECPAGGQTHAPGKVQIQYLVCPNRLNRKKQVSLEITAARTKRVIIHKAKRCYHKSSCRFSLGVSFPTPKACPEAILPSRIVSRYGPDLFFAGFGDEFRGEDLESLAF